MHEQYFFNRRFQIRLIVNRDRWAYLEGRAHAKHGTEHKEHPHAFLHTGLTEEQIQGLVKYIRGLTQQGTPLGFAIRRGTTWQ
jgi:hypothetical protein